MWPTYSWPNAFIIPFTIVIVIALFCRAFPAETDLVLGALLMIGTILFSLLTGPFGVCAVVPVRAMCVVRASAERAAIWIVTYVVFGACVGLVTFVSLHAKKKKKWERSNQKDDLQTLRPLFFFERSRQPITAVYLWLNNSVFLGMLNFETLEVSVLNTEESTV